MTTLRGVIVATGRRKPIFGELMTEACVTFPALSALAAGYQVHVVGACDLGWSASDRRGSWRRLRYRPGLCAGYDQARVRNAPIRH
ncbi:isochorismatase family protein [Bradyrhizobium sp. 23AC]